MVNVTDHMDLPEIRNMVKRDPGFADTFPIRKEDRPVTDWERHALAIPVFSRLNVPLCMSAEELYEWANHLSELAYRIRGTAANKDVLEKHRLMDIHALVKSFNAIHSDPKIRETQRRQSAKRLRDLGE